MEEYTQITLTEWLSWKEDIRKKLQETAGNFVHIGYRLKQIRDSGMYDGCQDIFEFAQKEYGLSKSTVSRFIAINEKFSEGGNSLELREEFRNIGSSKLSEMLTLPDADCALITERTTVKEIRELKEFNRQAVPVEELEEAEEEPVATSQQNPEDIVDTEAETDPGEAEESARQQEPERDAKTEESISYTPLQKCIIDFFGDNVRRQGLCQIMDILTGEVTEDKLKTAAEAANPGDYCTHKKGMVFLFMYDWQQGVKYKLMTAPEPVSMTWPEFLREIQDIYLQAYVLNPEDVWGEFYSKKSERMQENPEQIQEKQERISEKTEQMPEKGEKDGTEERGADSEGVGEEPERQQDAIEREAEAAPEGETAGEATAGEAQPAGREEPESCCDVATESPEAIVNTAAEDSSEVAEHCEGCRFLHPEGQAKRIAYASVCEECTEGSNYQLEKAPEGQQESEQEEMQTASDLERQLRRQIIGLTEEIRARVKTVTIAPLEIEDVRTAHAAARKLLALMDRLMDIKESEQEEIEGQMSLTDWENES